MTITPNKDGTLSVFVRLTATKGAVFDALNIPDAISGMVNAIAEHCTNTGEHPAKIIPSGTVFQ